MTLPMWWRFLRAQTGPGSTPKSCAPTAASREKEKVMKQTILITGASSGFGALTCWLFNTAVLVRSRSGSASTRLGGCFLRDFDFGIGNGLLRRRRQLQRMFPSCGVDRLEMERHAANQRHGNGRQA